MITGSTAFTKDGNGILDLGGTNTYTGATNIDDGTLQITGALAQTAVTVASGATYDSDTTDTIGSIDGAGELKLIRYNLNSWGTIHQRQYQEYLW